ncbi:hypothetical protein fugu_018797, partial [Takifugu bimaculatus]
GCGEHGERGAPEGSAGADRLPEAAGAGVPRSEGNLAVSCLPQFPRPDEARAGVQGGDGSAAPDDSLCKHHPEGEDQLPSEQVAERLNLDHLDLCEYPQEAERRRVNTSLVLSHTFGCFINAQTEMVGQGGRVGGLCGPEKVPQAMSSITAEEGAVDSVVSSQISTQNRQILYCQLKSRTLRLLMGKSEA